jgi:hypothetical protein
VVVLSSLKCARRRGDLMSQTHAEDKLTGWKNELENNKSNSQKQTSLKVRLPARNATIAADRQRRPNMSTLP